MTSTMCYNKVSNRTQYVEQQQEIFCVPNEFIEAPAGLGVETTLKNDGFERSDIRTNPLMQHRADK